MQVDPIKPKSKPPGTKRLKLKCDILLSTSAFKFNLRRYNLENEMEKALDDSESHLGGAVQVDPTKHNLKAPVS